MRPVGGLARSVENDVGDAMYDGNLGTEINWPRRVGRLQVEREKRGGSKTRQYQWMLYPIDG